MTAPSPDGPPDRLSNDPSSPYFNAEALARDVGIRFKGVEKTNVEEYCISEGWVRVAAGKALGRTCLTFVSEASLHSKTGPRQLGLDRQLVAVRRCRKIGKKDMVLNHALPKIEVDPETYTVKADGEHLTCEPAKVLPLAQRYFLF